MAPARGEASPVGEGVPVGEIFQFRREALICKIKYVIPTTFGRHGDLLEVAHRKAKFFKEEPDFPIFSIKTQIFQISSHKNPDFLKFSSTFN